MKKILKKLLAKFKLNENILYYVSGSEGLPQPLDPREESEVIERLAAGDTSARALLIERNIRLVVYIARKFENTGADLDDLISVGAIGLIKAVNSFDVSKNIKLATYASRCIENEILMYLRRIVKIKSEVYLDEPLNVDWEGNELLLGDILGTESDTVYKNLENNAEKDLLWEALRKLNRREQEIMALRFGLKGVTEKTQKEVADMLGISQSYISRLEKKIIYRLRKEMVKLV